MYARVYRETRRLATRSAIRHVVCLAAAAKATVTTSMENGHRTASKLPLAVTYSVSNPFFNSFSLRYVPFTYKSNRDSKPKRGPKGSCKYLIQVAGTFCRPLLAFKTDCRLKCLLFLCIHSSPCYVNIFSRRCAPKTSFVLCHIEEFYERCRMDALPCING